MKHGTFASRRLRLGIAVALAGLYGCGGVIPRQPSSGTDATAAYRTQGKKIHLNITPKSLTFTSAKGKGFTVEDDGYTGLLTVASSATKVAVVSPDSKHGPAAQFTVKPVGGGTCTIVAKDDRGGKASLRVTVENGIIVVHVRREDRLNGEQ